MKIYTSEFNHFIESLHARKMKIILVTGVFDLLHQEHKVFLNKAKKLGDLLLVGVESDLRVKQIKGKDRPIWTQEKRKQAIEKLGVAKLVFILPEQFSNESDHWKLIQQIQPRYLAVSSHSPHIDQKKKLLEKIGGEVVVVHVHNPTISTTLSLQKNSTPKV